MTDQEHAEMLDQIRDLRERLFVDQIEAFLFDAAMADRLARLAVPS